MADFMVVGLEVLAGAVGVKLFAPPLAKLAKIETQTAELALAGGLLALGIFDGGKYGHDIAMIALGALAPAAQEKVTPMLAGLIPGGHPSVSGPFHVGHLPSGAALWLPEHAAMYAAAGYPVS